MSVAEVETFNLEEQLLDHLSEPQSAMQLYRERITPDLLIKNEDYGLEVLTWVSNFIGEHGQAPTRQIVENQFPKIRFYEPTSPVTYLIEELRKRHARRRLEGTFETVARAMEGDPLGATQQAYSELHTIVQETHSQKNVFDAVEWRPAYEEYKEQVRTGALNGVTFGYDEIDEATGGMRRGLYFYVGRLKRYKSWMLLKSSIEAARTGNNVVFFSLEMSSEEMFERFECMSTNTSYARRRKGAWTKADYAKYEKWKEYWEEEFAAGRYGIHKILHPPIAERTVPLLLEQAKFYDADVVYIDQFKFINATRTHRDRHREAEWICEELKIASNEIPIAVAAQFNRQAASIGEMGEAAQIAISDALGQTADMILGTYQDKNLREGNMLEFGTVEARSVRGGTWIMQVEFNDGCDILFYEEKEEDDD